MIAQRYGLNPFEVIELIENPYRRELLLYSLHKNKTEAVQIGEMLQKSMMNVGDAIGTSVCNRLNHLVNIGARKQIWKQIKSLFKKDGEKEGRIIDVNGKKIRMLN